MKKITFTFPSYDSMWSFRDQTNAIHIRIKPKDRLISGLFDPKEIEIAEKKFHAAQNKQEEEKK